MKNSTYNRIMDDFNKLDPSKQDLLIVILKELLSDQQSMEKALHSPQNRTEPIKKNTQSHYTTENKKSKEKMKNGF